MAGQDFDSVGIPQEFDFDTAEEFELTVPTNRLFEIYAVAFVWGASGNAGNREVQVVLANRGGNVVVFRRTSRRIQVANESIRYVWAPGMPDETDTVALDQLLQPMPLLSLEEGGFVRIQDNAGIDVADTLAGSIMARVYKGE